MTQPTPSSAATRPQAPPHDDAGPRSDASSPEVTALHVLVESSFGLDGGAMFGVVPKPLWSRQAPADDANRIDMAARLLVLDVAGGARRVLVEAGMGTRWSPKEQAIYRVEHPEGALRAHLRTRGIDPDSITDVILTHLHFDHAGGLIEADGRPSFPGATHHVQREQWVWAHHPTLRDAGSYRRETFGWLGAGSDAPLVLHDGPSSVADVIELFPLFGHTPGMQAVAFRCGGQRFVAPADLIPTAAHAPLAWVMGYDLHPTVTVREKAEVLAQVMADDALLILGHDPAHAFHRVERHGPDRWSVVASADAWESLRQT